MGFSPLSKPECTCECLCECGSFSTYVVTTTHVHAHSHHDRSVRVLVLWLETEIIFRISNETLCRMYTVHGSLDRHYKRKSVCIGNKFAVVVVIVLVCVI